MSAVDAAEHKKGSICVRLPHLPAPLPPACCPCPHSFVLTPSYPTLRGSQLRSPPPASFSLLTFLMSVLSDTPLPPCPSSSPPSPPPHLFSPQTFLASSGGLYCLGGGCGTVVIPGCMSSALQLACSGLAMGCMGWTWHSGLPPPEQAPQGQVKVGTGALC